MNEQEVITIDFAGTVPMVADHGNLTQNLLVVIQTLLDGKVPLASE